MTSASRDGLPRRIEGTSGELVDLFIELVDRAPRDDPYWWYNYGALAGVRVGVALRPEAGRSVLMRALRSALERIVAAGLDEAFLIRSLKADLDEFVERMGDTEAYDAKIEQMRQHLQEVINNPAVRERWREVRGKQDPALMAASDEQIIAEAQEGYESFGKKLTTADEAAQRWAGVAAWREVASALLPDEVFKRWSARNIQRAIDQERGRQQPPSDLRP